MIEEFSIEHVSQIGGSPYHFAAIKAWVEIVEAGYGDGANLSISYDDQAIVMKDGETVIGLIVWRNLKWCQSAWVCVGWVRPEYRRRGFYRRLYEATRNAAKVAGARLLDGGVNPANSAILKSAEAMGRVQHGITLRDTLE